MYKIRINLRSLLYICFFLYLVQFIMSYFEGEWTYINEKFTMMPKYTITINVIRMAYLLIFLTVGICEIIRGWKKLRTIDQILFTLFFLIATIKFIQVAFLVDTQTILFQSGTPTMYFAMIAFFIGLDEKLKFVLLKLSKLYSSTFFGLLFVYFLQFCLTNGYSIGVRFASGPILYSFNNAFFLLVYALYHEDDLKKKKFWLVILPVCILSSFITTSRGWVLQALFMFLMYYMLMEVKKNIGINILKATIIVSTLIVIISVVTPGVFSTLINRISESTRSTQLEMFFNQVSLTDLIKGLGYNASYVFLQWSDYKYIDNQVIFSAFRYGAIITVIYMYFLLKPVLISWRERKELQLRLFGILHFVLAMIGISIYFSLSIELYCISTYIFAGRIYSIVYEERNYFKPERLQNGEKS